MTKVPAFASSPSRSSALRSSADSISCGRSSGDGQRAGLERARQRPAQPALGQRHVQFGAIDADPCAAAGGLGAHIGQDHAVGRQRESDQRHRRSAILGQDALADRTVDVGVRARV
ncbi:hypothetical protein QE452_002430 [Sphingomonas sp. SORGH_AS438]|nr:hypothetical protein [Sphingomonas sp. SORGH_AS_0438]